MGPTRSSPRDIASAKANFVERASRPGDCSDSGSAGAGRPGLIDWRLRRVLDYVAANLGERITLTQLAEAAGLSRMHFAALFRASTGLSPQRFVRSCRIAHARALLASSNLPVVQVALSAGFQSQAHFTTVFGQVTGQTPAAFRRAGVNAATQASADWITGG